MTKFDVGHLVITATAQDKLDSRGPEAWAMLHTAFHAYTGGNWGNIDEHDRRQNEEALTLGNRLLGAYTIGEGNLAFMVWIITEADRSVTTILLPEDY